MRLTQESQAIEEDPARSVGYSYELAGNVTQLAYPGGTTVATTFDGNNRRDVIDKDGSQIADYDYVGRRVDQPGATQHRAACCVLWPFREVHGPWLTMKVRTRQKG